MELSSPRGEFQNEPFTDFSQSENRESMQRALADVQVQLGQSYDIVIAGQHLRTQATFASLSPGDPRRVVGVFPKGTPELADRAVRAAHQAFEAWKRTPPPQRSAYLFQAAAAMRRRRHEFSAFMVYEVGKTWPEADADTAEAIDFLEFYARESLRYAGPHPITAVAGEKNALVYLPLGVGIVIPPWNFPLAILVGMTSAAIVTGNTVVLKPSSDAPTIAAQFVRLMESLGLPAGVLNFLPGGGAEVGDTLVAHPLTRFVAFTGSKAVGLHINELAAKPQPGQRWIKRVVAEMGGKDAIIVDRDTDLDEAAAGVVASAYGFQGQKCSACSRAIVDAQVYDAFVERLKQRVDALRVGPPEDPQSQVGPVINEKAMRSIQEYIESGRQQARLLAGGEPAKQAHGFFLQPTVFVDVDPQARISQEEIFGPVLAVTRARDFDDALRIANDTEYGLTGAVYTRDASKLERARQEFFVGNLYLNRKCTGAMVGGHPFGGFNMSGTDSKAGGRDYLLLFLQGQSIAEKVRA